MGLKMKVRFPKFDFSEIRAHWTKNPEFAQRCNAASLIPAYVEPYLLKVMNQARAKIDPSKTALLKDLDIFNKQEMQHLKQHIGFNKRMHAIGYEGLKTFEAEYAADYERFLATKSLRFHLAYCEGFESLSATACELYFTAYNEFLDDADPEPTNMWRWHLAEEFEHRTVCSDVYHELAGLDPVSRYFYRLYGYFYAIIHIGGFSNRVSKWLLEQDRAKMTPEEVEQSLARDKYARKIMGKGFLPMAFKIMMPWYDPAKRPTPPGYDAYLQSFEKNYNKPELAAA
jgi:predicted metal-dependent hydrolase